jgi:Mg/Co/Ni transporter MgtE
MVVLDFIFGGVIVAVALLIASFLGPVYGGILAGAPIRAGGTIFLQYLHEGEAKAADLSLGVLFSMIANVGFAAVLLICIPRIGFYQSFLLASVVFVVMIAVLMKITS